MVRLESVLLPIKHVCHHIVLHTPLRLSASKIVYFIIISCQIDIKVKSTKDFSQPMMSSRLTLNKLPTNVQIIVAQQLQGFVSMHATCLALLALDTHDV